MSAMNHDAVSEPVFACTLLPNELRKRRTEVLAAVRRQVQHLVETSEGFVFTFARSPALEAELAEFVRFEAACCAFLEMSLEASADTLTLRMAGAPGAKPFMRLEFVAVGAEAATPSDSCGCAPGR